MKILKKSALRAAATALLVAASALAAALGALADARTDEATRRVFENSAPIAENLEYGTFKAVPINGRFAARDPEGDAVTFEIITPPKRGGVEHDGTGAFVYSPNDNARGRDSLEYVAIDAYGNVSSPATVKITIRKRATKTSYSDMDGDPAQYAALVLADEGIFTGEQLGQAWFFHPEREVTRGEFLAMCMRVSGGDIIDGVTRTGFFDDDSIPAWVKPYISTGLVAGAINGYKNEEGKLVFSPQKTITVSEAAVVLNNILQITDVGDVGVLSVDAAPAWALSASVNLASCGILPHEALSNGGRAVTRADAAQMLAASYVLLEARDDDKSLFSLLG
ncbi:MAG: S-layer homology domain-containing protein [Oscillospiraceae bacterium]|jgi:hypothetical protein|nr:S-layer homology domain-containing protein [Oscillospiraceae bacterium]